MYFEFGCVRCWCFCSVELLGTLISCYALKLDHLLNCFKLACVKRQEEQTTFSPQIEKKQEQTRVTEIEKKNKRKKMVKSMFTVDRFVRYSASQSMCLSSLDLVNFLCISNECRARDDAVYLRKSHMWCICMKQKTHNVLKISAHSKSDTEHKSARGLILSLHHRFLVFKFVLCFSN